MLKQYLVLLFVMLMVFISRLSIAAESAPRVVHVETLTSPTPLPKESSTKYDPQTTAMLLNYCRESLYKVVEFNDRAVLDEEYGRLINNIDITRIQDDEVAQLIELLLKELNALRLTDAERQYLTEAYNRRVGFSVLEALKGSKDLKDIKIPTFGAKGPAAVACQAIVVIAAGVTGYKSQFAKQQRDAKMRLMALNAQELNRLTTLRTRFFDTEYKLYKRYSLPDRLNLKEVQMEQYIRVLADDDAGRRLERLERLKEDFQAFPPFWYEIGKAAQETGDVVFAKSYYEHFERINARVFREDLDYVMLCMHRILLWNPESEADAIRRDLKTIEDNTRYYYKWENILFAALKYYELGDFENARRLIRISINEGYCVALHEQILTEMESQAAKEKLREQARDLAEKSDVEALESLGDLGPGEQLEALRAMGSMITDIRLSVDPRSHTGQNASYFVPLYNLYSLGRVVKGTAYFDDIVVQLPEAWFANPGTKVKLRSAGRSYNASNATKDKDGTRRLTFTRVFKEEDIVEKKKQVLLALHVETKTMALVVGFEAKPVTPQIERLHPELTGDTPFFEMKSIVYKGRRYEIDDGLIVYREKGAL